MREIMTNQQPTAGRDYAIEQFKLGNALDAAGNTAQAREHWSNIKRDDDPKTYAKAQFNLGCDFDDEGDTAQAHAHWSNIKREESYSHFWCMTNK